MITEILLALFSLCFSAQLLTDFHGLIYRTQTESVSVTYDTSLTTRSFTFTNEVVGVTTLSMPSGLIISAMRIEGNVVYLGGLAQTSAGSTVTMTAVTK